MGDTKQLTVVDFFCGAGGFSEGFRQQGFRIIQGYDNWRPAIDTFNHNFGTNSECYDILNFNNSIEEINKVPNTDVIIGSPPCVSFSSSNNSGKADKTKGLLLIKAFLRIVVIKKFQKDSILKAWYMENVPNSKKYLPASFNFEDLELTEWAEENGLNPQALAITLEGNQPVINAADYGSYQSRKRVISGEIIAAKKLIVPAPTHSNVDQCLPKWRSLKELLQLMPSPILKDESIIVDPIYPTITLSSKLLTDHFYDSGIYQSKWSQAKRLKTNHPYMGVMSFPENLEKPSRTVLATISASTREAHIYQSEYNRKGDGEYRSPTVREAATIMGFPYTYQFLGSANPKWRLVGNAVCPSVSRAFAGELLKHLNLEIPSSLKVTLQPKLEGVINLNNPNPINFSEASVKIKNSRFRGHPLKVGNLTVTLSNYDIATRGDVGGAWMTSIQYGTGSGFPIQKVDDYYYEQIEETIKKFPAGESFINRVNNGFSDKIGTAKQLQMMYEQCRSTDLLTEPTLLIEKLKQLIDEAGIADLMYKQEQIKFFSYKAVVPVSQLFALYAVNKISTIANGEYNGSKNENQ
ncbi:DNA cytosine methyltransferase [Methylophilus sp. 14]|uniref:DNA cytosine methyltransferase n=1 Tax=Methylophilus sp. 14 TaxID=2781019 RepID=UPI00188E593D|nr:DNA cytosine methyltransferase [Methylophilus sp. 14]